jgi:plasmid stability protein
MVARRKKPGVSMHSLTIRAIPRPMLDRLQKRAELNRRSMQGEVLAILEAAANGAASSTVPKLAESVAEAFGIWRNDKGNKVPDGLDYERAIRREWGK